MEESAWDRLVNNICAPAYGSLSSVMLTHLLHHHFSYNQVLLWGVITVINPPPPVVFSWWWPWWWKHTRSQPVPAFAAVTSQLSSVLSDWLSQGSWRNGQTVRPEADHQRQCCMRAAVICNEGTDVVGLIRIWIRLCLLCTQIYSLQILWRVSTHLSVQLWVLTAQMLF